MRLLLLALTAALALPAAAHAGGLASLSARDVPLRAGAPALAPAQPRFDLVGLHWRGRGAVEFRTRSLAGRWSAWRPAAPEDEDRPDPAAQERTRAGWRIGNPYWTGPSDRLEVRTSGRVTRVKAFYVRSGGAGSRPPARALAAADAPRIVPRVGWNANELIKRGAPSYSASLGFAVVHHTAGTNTYTAAESAAIVRGIQLYHVQGNGWNDIGYNFLIDKYGQVFEGRAGGIERNVVGAHAEGFNTGSTGVAVLGNYGSASIAPAARDALVKLLAWRLDVAHVDPLSTLSWASGGNSRFARGVPVFLRTISGHRDTGFTDCPGSSLYAQIDSLAQAVSRTGLPKVYAPAVQGGLGGRVRFTARLSGAVPWTVAVTDQSGVVVATGTGTGPALDWTWDAGAAPPGSYSWSIAAPGARPAAGTLGRPAVLSISRVAATPAAVTPNGDGVDDATSISYVLGAAATVTATLVDPAGTVIATLFSEPRAAGPQAFAFTAEGVPDGRYTVVLTAVNGDGRQVTGRAALLVNRTLSSFTAPRPRSPADRRRPPRHDRLHLRARRAGDGPAPDRARRDVDRDPGAGRPARARRAVARVGRAEAGRQDARRDLSRRAVGDRRERDRQAERRADARHEAADAAAALAPPPCAHPRQRGGRGGGRDGRPPARRQEGRRRRRRPADGGAARPRGRVRRRGQPQQAARRPVVARARPPGPPLDLNDQ